VNGRQQNLRFEDVYEPTDDPPLGQGAFGPVVVYKNRRSGYRFAVKITAPSPMDAATGLFRSYDDVEQRCQEVKALVRLRDENPLFSKIVFLYEYFWDVRSNRLFLVTNILGEDLYVWSMAQRRQFLEGAVKKVAKVILNALTFMHSRNIVHRDLKLQNILFQEPGNLDTIKICDFGLARCLDDGRPLPSEFVGSLGSIAPEIYKGEKVRTQNLAIFSQPKRHSSIAYFSIPWCFLLLQYGVEVDMFAFGVIIFRLLSGQRPFSAQNQEKLRRDTLDLRYDVHKHAWMNVSRRSHLFVRKLLIGRDQRLSVKQALEHDWLHTNDESRIHMDMTVTLQLHNDDDSMSEVVATVSYDHGGIRFFFFFFFPFP
jgi:serine/threonine protein kinase